MLNILWDASHLWGYAVLHAMRAAGITYRLLKASEIAQYGVSGKVLLVPGGGARAKAKALGSRGKEAVRSFVHEGGHYLGICGGAGLGLADGLGLSPWVRAGISDKLQHLVSVQDQCSLGEHGRGRSSGPLRVSGHMICELERDELAPEATEEDKKHGVLLPIWWPGRFKEPEAGSEAYGEVRVLARYRSPGPDLYVSDLALSMLPPEVLADWNAVYGVTVRPSLLDGQPCITTGNFGQGSWVLSYSHLETPESPDAGRFLAHLLRTWGIADDAVAEKLRASAAWMPDTLEGDTAWPVLWEDAALLKAWQSLQELFSLARQSGLLFNRSSWLMGWRSGMPGAQLNGLRAALRATVSLLPTDERRAAWKLLAPRFSTKFEFFVQGAKSWLLARRLADTLADSMPGILPKALLDDQKDMLFGSPMSSGGLCGELQDLLENQLFV